MEILVDVVLIKREHVIILNGGMFVEIRCTASKRFLLSVDIETYNKSIEDLTKASINLPLIIHIPCPKCKMIEEYHIYPNHYIHKKSFKKEF